jgi:hypothetical protein
MSTNQTPVETTEDDLDTFSAEFFGQKQAPKEQASSEDTEDEIDDNEVDAQTDTQDGEDDTPAAEADDTDEAEDEDEDDESDPEPEPKPKRNRAQERIEELNAKFRETERRLNEALAKLEQKAEPAPVVTKKVETNTGPTPEDTNEDGSEKYPLGEFDPMYIRDLTRHTIQTERDAMKVQEQVDEQRVQMERQRAELQADWNTKLVPAQERYPDFLEKGETLISQFDGLDPSYGEYLTTTLMSMEYGPDVLYYLSNNQDEAKQIVASGAAKATIALGRLEAKFAFANEEKQRARPKVSKAPTPPAHVNKGSSAAKPDVPDDTDDLDDFADKFFSKTKRKA